MPSTSKKQHNLMAAVAHNPAFAKRVGISQDVGKHFMAKDKGKRFADGGSANEAMPPPSPPDKDVAASTENAASNYRKVMAELLRRQQAAKAVKDAQLKELMSVGRKHGGSIHKMKEGGHVEKESKEMAEAEMKALKRGRAPKAVMEHEKAEHKAMGYKKGGHVKKHEKHMRRGGVSAAPMGAPRRRVNPATLAALMGGAGPAAPMGAPVGGPPGMAHGGGVHHHHHHYYGGGGVETGHAAGVEKVIKGKSKHGDGAAKKGHTKGKVR